MRYYNLDKLVKIILNDEYKSFNYFYNKEIKFLGIVFKKAGFYGMFAGYYVGNPDPKRYFLRDNHELFEKPEVILHYQDAHPVTYYFDTYNEAVGFKNKVLSGRWITEDGSLIDKP